MQPVQDDQVAGHLLDHLRTGVGRGELLLVVDGEHVRDLLRGEPRLDPFEREVVVLDQGFEVAALGDEADLEQLRCHRVTGHALGDLDHP